MEWSARPSLEGGGGVSPSDRIGYILHILDCLGQVNAGFIQVLYLGRAPRTKETLPDFREKCRVTDIHEYSAG